MCKDNKKHAKIVKQKKKHKEDIKKVQERANAGKDRNVQEAAESLSLLLKGEQNNIYFNKWADGYWPDHAWIYLLSCLI